MPSILPDGSQGFPVPAYILQLQTAFTTIATGVIWAILGVSVAIMRIQDRERTKKSGRVETRQNRA